MSQPKTKSSKASVPIQPPQAPAVEAVSDIPPAAVDIKPKKLALGGFKVWIVIGAVVCVVVVVLMLYLRHRSKKLKEELLRQKRSELSLQSDQATQAWIQQQQWAQQQQQYFNEAPPGLYNNNSPVQGQDDRGNNTAQKPSNQTTQTPTPTQTEQRTAPVQVPSKSATPPPQMAPSPPGTVREIYDDELPNMPPPVAIPAEPLNNEYNLETTMRHEVPVQAPPPPMPVLINDPYLEPVGDLAPPEAKKKKTTKLKSSPKAASEPIQNAFKIDLTEENAFSPIVKPVLEEEPLVVNNDGQE